MDEVEKGELALLILKEQIKVSGIPSLRDCDLKANADKIAYKQSCQGKKILELYKELYAEVLEESFNSALKIL